MTPLAKTTSAFFLSICLGVAPALADGGGGGGGGGGGEGGGSGGRDSDVFFSSPEYRAAVKEIDKKNYEAAIPLLQKVVASDPEDADAYNYLGYTHRQLGKMDEAVGFYQQALSIDPDHLGANEYLGELYLQVGDLGKAQKRLEILDDACFFGCDQYYKLRDAIDDYKKKAGSG